MSGNPSDTDISYKSEKNEECEGGTFLQPYNEYENSSKFQMYTTYAKPGLVSIFNNEDQRCFHNWAMEMGVKPKRGRIREEFDHQINSSVLEVAGEHDGSVYMMCPPTFDTTMDVETPYITILMRDMHGYCSVEFTVLDNLGFSRKIHSKNFKSRCTIGELNCEIPMRLSPTWNYACVNLDEALRNAFGTKLSLIQRVKINANCRVRRVYFSDEIFPFKMLPQEFRIRLSLSATEKKQMEMYEAFLSSEPSGPERNIPWALPKLPAYPELGRPSALFQSANGHGLRKNVEILEVPAGEREPDKYANVREAKDTNSGLLRNMLQKTIPPSKILLPTLSLIYPDNHGQTMGDGDRVKFSVKKKDKDSVFFAPETASGELRRTCGEEDVGGKADLKKLKRCLEQHSRKPKKAGAELAQTDWDMINHEPPHQPGDSHPHHHHIHGCTYNTIDLARYLKKREVLGEYDLFSGTLGNKNFLDVGMEDDEDEEEEVDQEEPQEIKEEPELKLSHMDSHPFHIRPLQSHDGASRSTFPGTRRSTVSRLTLQDPSRAHHHHPAEAEDAGGGGDKVSVHSLTSEESWVLTWAYAGLSWAETREVNQKLLSDARVYVATATSENPHQQQRKSIVETSRASKLLREHHKPQVNRVPEMYRAAIPVMPKPKKNEQRGLGEYYDLVFDNPTLPIQYY